MSYTWDANGNLLSDGIYNYDYNTAIQLVGVSAIGLALSYTYTGLGNRLSQTVNGVTTSYPS